MKRGRGLNLCFWQCVEEIDALAKGNAEKRKRAQGLKKDISNLQADFSSMNSNFSASLEFADMTKQDLGRGLHSKDLKVLSEVEKKRRSTWWNSLPATSSKYSVWQGCFQD